MLPLVKFLSIITQPESGHNSSHDLKIPLKLSYQIEITP